MSILGIDPGINGGLALISDDGAMAEYIPTLGGYIDLPTLATWLRENQTRIDGAYLEHVHAIFGSSAGNTFTFGRVFGAVEALLAALKIPYVLVQPKVWQKVIHAGIDKNLKAKEKSRIAASRLFPNIDLRATERSKVPHDGMTDALLIAEYGRRTHGAVQK